MFMPDRFTVRALLAFRAAHGRCWKAKLLFLWSTGRDVEEADGACPRQRRNQAGPAWLNQLSPYRWRAIGRLAEPGDRQTASIFLDRAREFHEGARLGAAVALAPALHLLAIFRAGARSLSYEPGLVERGGARAMFVTTYRRLRRSAATWPPVPGPYSRRFAHEPRSRLCRTSYRRAGGGWLCLRFRGHAARDGSRLDAVAAGLSLPTPTP